MSGGADSTAALSADGAAATFDTHEPPSRALIDACVHCGFCLPSCPTYVLWGEEMDSPRGRIYLMSAGLDGRTSMSAPFVRHFDACLGCMACVTACPSGVQYAPLIEATRAQIARRHTRSLADRLFRAAIFAIFPYPARVRVALLPLALVGPLAVRLGSSKADDPQGTASGFWRRVRAALALAPSVTLRSLFARHVPERTAAAGERRMTVGLLTGCVQRVV